MSTIVLKDSTAADITFKLVGTNGNSVIFDAAGSTLLSRKRLTLQVSEGKNANRVKFKLSVPTVCAQAPGCVPTVSYTQVASGDYSIVRFSSEIDRQDLSAMVASLTANNTIKDMIVDGSLPTA